MLVQVAGNNNGANADDDDDDDDDDGGPGDLPSLGSVLWPDTEYGDITTERKRVLYNKIAAFIENESARVLNFSPSVSGLERKWLHAVLELANLEHVSEGEGDERHLVARKLSDGENGSAGDKLTQKQMQKLEEPHIEALLVEIRHFLKHIPTNAKPRVPVGTVAVTPEGVAQLEQLADKLAAKELGTRKVVTRQPFDDLRVAIDEVDALVDDSHLSEGHFQLGNRVIVMASSIAVPFGARGTVIGVEKRGVDVLFDHRYMGGTNLLGRCSNLRGLRLPAKILLHASAADAASAPVPPPHANSHSKGSASSSSNSHGSKKPVRSARGRGAGSVEGAKKAAKKQQQAHEKSSSHSG